MVASRATYASIPPGTANAWRDRASPRSASAGVTTDRMRTRASMSGRIAVDTSSALASASTTGCRFAPLMAVDADAISAIVSCVSTPAARADASASARIVSYEPFDTTTCR